MQLWFRELLLNKAASQNFQVSLRQSLPRHVLSFLVNASRTIKFYLDAPSSCPKIFEIVMFILSWPEYL